MKNKKIFCIITLFFLLTACNSNTLKTEKISASDMEKVKNQSIETATLYKDLYLKADKTKSEYFPYENELSQAGIDEIENYFVFKGYPVINSDGKYPDYLENSDVFYDFWRNVSAQKEVDQAVIALSTTGGLYYTLFKFSDNKKYRIAVTVEWNENNEPFVSSEQHGEISDWDMINDSDFYYQSALQGVSYDDYSLIRLKPIDKELYDLNAKYILPIGYISNNMFVSEWTYRDYGELCFNDLLEAFYKMKNNDYFYADKYPKIREPYLHSYIPSDLFENTIMPYFDISLSEFRKRCLFDSKKNIYPWQEIYCENIIIYPWVEPEVIKCQDNDDGTITLTVNARCNEYKTPRLFTHEVVIRPINDSEHIYLSNKITYKSDRELPPNRPRLPSQRTNS